MEVREQEWSRNRFAIKKELELAKWLEQQTKTKCLGMALLELDESYRWGEWRDW